MAKSELVALRDLKIKLLQRAMKLIAQLKEQEKHKEKTTLSIPTTINSIKNEENKLFKKPELILCKVIRQVTGMTFKDINKRWLKDNVYCYTTNLITKTLSFIVELTVNLEGEKEFEVLDITCHFVNIDQCYMLEIEPWIQNITKMKNFSLLTSAITQYNNQNVSRANIMQMLEEQKYGTSEQCTEKNGGFLIYVHSPNNVEKVYLKCQWSLLFIERTWQIENFFNIETMEPGIEFVQQNQGLLQSFCKVHIERKKLLDLWQQLCFAINLYEDAVESTMNRLT